MQVFREFCTLAYMEGIYIFDHRSFEKFYKKLKSKDELNNPKKFTLSAFEHDVCATACMMYEQESGIFYIDPGFQDYFFAEFYYFEDTDPTKEMGHALWDRKIDSFRNLDALKNTLLNKPLIDEYMNKPLKAEKFDFVPETNFTKNVIYGLICDLLGIPNTFVIGSLETEVEQVGATHFVAGFYDNVRDYDAPEENQHTWLRGMKHDVRHIGDRQYFQDLEFSPFPVTDNTGQAVCFGYDYIVAPMSLMDWQSITKKKRNVRNCIALYGLILTMPRCQMQ